MTFDNSDELAEKLKTGVCLTNDIIYPEYVFYDDSLLNPYRIGDENGDIAINTAWDECDGQTNWRQ